MEPKKSLGQHWLKDGTALEAMCQAADLKKADYVLEVGPGLGDLTRQLLARAGQVAAVELDSDLADNLGRQLPDPRLKIISGNILEFDLTRLPAGYKVVANIPYYLTSHLVRLLAESANPPSTAVLLVQREVAERIAAQPGQMSLLSVSTQFYFEPSLGAIVPAELFEPPPKVDSQIITLNYRHQPLFGEIDT
ncbi:MAG TPA: 16S rRNA (adenine(1518)-N(6)/adenine(1519)-N(6))-dimethyltransferase RsmA, partial [Candidatus Saccharimonadales bacterium]|nr:16S rRNA (adenine(1518)-N(6)/adenine(1519)-N(6))-dimethyltransferase RsmA [Candidatus Saccharimonadales bacterium]